MDQFRDDTPLILVFSDLQDWPEYTLDPLQLFAKLASKKRLPWLILIETREELLPPYCQNFLASLKISFPFEKLCLQDLSSSQAKKLLSLAAVDGSLTTTQAESLTNEAGGRPLFLLEALKTLLENALPQKTPGEPREPLKNIKFLNRARVEKLSSGAKLLLSLVSCHPQEVSFSEAQRLWNASDGFYEEALLELDQKKFLQPRNTSTSGLRLEHLSLGKTLQEVLPEDLLQESHRRWVRLLLKKFEEKNAEPKEIILLAKHGWAAGDIPVIKEWAMKAAVAHSTLGDLLAAIEEYQNVLKLAETAEERMVIHASLAPLFFRLGKFDEALLAYDRWIADRVDDDSGLQKVKHLYYTGFTLSTAGRNSEAELRLRECLKVGDGQKHPPHRPYLARAHYTLASMLEKEGKFDEARLHLKEASQLAEDQALLLGDVEQCRGELEQLSLNYSKALHHYQNAKDYYGQAQNSQAEAMALHLYGLVHKECGNFIQARESLRAPTRLRFRSANPSVGPVYGTCLVSMDLENTERRGP
jgi:tetratricopeptide (TPR) repeat protein